MLGVDDPYLDVEVIALGWRFFEALGLRQVTLLLNSLGEPADRARYVEALRRHFGADLDALSDREPRDARRATRCACSTPSAARTPPLDRRRAADRRLLERRGARRTSPRCATASTPSGSRTRVEPRLVRGLDYYLRTTFEFAGGTLDGAQNALGGGGRYDGLVEALGGPPTPGIGFALGVDRTLLACDDEGVFAARRARRRRVRRRHHRGRARRSSSPRSCAAAGIAPTAPTRTLHEGADEGGRPQRRGASR